jgi:long-subunit acyl-CoA synthetase (AMP-forming)
MARRVGSWILSRGHKLYFLYSLNCPNWTICDIASWNYGIINVPLYDTLGEEAFDHILNVT